MTGPAAGGAGWRWAWLRHPALAVLALAAFVRLAPVLFEIPLGRDIIEYRNAAENLAAGRGLALDIRAYYASDTPVHHYAVYERAPLLPAMLAGLSFPLGMDLASRLIGPLLWLAALALLVDWMRGWAPGRTALWAGALLAVHPGLLEVSLRPLSEVVVLFCVAAALWARGRRVPWLAGLACALAFLARPSAGLAGIVFGLLYLREWLAGGPFRALAGYAAAAILGPAALVALNLANGAQPLLTPQSFLFRLMDHAQYVHEFQNAPLYRSPGALLAARGPEVARLIAKNVFNYGRELAVGVAGLAPLAPLAILAGLGIVGSARRARGQKEDTTERSVARAGANERASGGAVQLGALAAVAVADLGLYCVTWSTYDAERFLALAWVAALVLIAAGAFGWTVRAGERGFVIPATLVPALLLPVVALWGAGDLWRGYVAWREFRIGLPYSAFYDPLLASPGEAEAADKLRELGAAGAFDGGTGPGIVGAGPLATDEPWRAWLEARVPSALIPFDLRPEEWGPFLKNLGARRVMLDAALWPEQYRKNYGELREALKKDWRLEWSEGGRELWARG